MSKHSKRRGQAASIGRGQSMQLTYRFPRMPDPPTLSKQAQDRLRAVEFSYTRGVKLASEAFGVCPATIYNWRKR